MKMKLREYARKTITSRLFGEAGAADRIAAKKKVKDTPRYIVATNLAYVFPEDNEFEAWIENLDTDGIDGDEIDLDLSQNVKLCEIVRKSLYAKLKNDVKINNACGCAVLLPDKDLDDAVDIAEIIYKGFSPVFKSIAEDNVEDIRDEFYTQKYGVFVLELKAKDLEAFVQKKTPPTLELKKQLIFEFEK